MKELYINLRKIFVNYKQINVKVMQKVIVIDTHTNTMGNDLFNEKEFPQLNQYLEDGYTIKQIIPVTLNSNTAYMYSLVFLLERV